MSGLTARQYEALTFIRSFIAEHGYSPSYDEIGAALGLTAKSGVHRMIQELRARGTVEIIPRARRSIWPVGLAR